jgi:hypothetical protein
MSMGMKAISMEQKFRQMNNISKDNLFKIRKPNDKESCFGCSKLRGDNQFYTDLYQCYIKKTLATICSDCLEKRINFYQELNKKEDVVKRIEERIATRNEQSRQSKTRKKNVEKKVEKILKLKPDASPIITKKAIENYDKIKKKFPEMIEEGSAEDPVEMVKRTEGTGEEVKCKKCEKIIGKTSHFPNKEDRICSDCYTTEVFESKPFAKTKPEVVRDEIEISEETKKKMAEPEKWCGCGSERIQVEEAYECYQRGDYQCPKCEVVIDKYIEYSLRDGSKLKLPERSEEEIAKLVNDYKEKKEDISEDNSD